MRMVVQRVLKARLSVEGEVMDEMERGLLVLVGIEPEDGREEVFAYMLDKLLHLRIFEDEKGKLNLSVEDLGLELFLISNFTLYGDARGGRRPSYSKGAGGELAREIYDSFLAYAREHAGREVHAGVFGADMKTETVLDGPVTILLDSDKLF